MNKKICLKPDCGRDAKIRGLCHSCYTVARKAITDGKTTWEKLEKDGKAIGRQRTTLDWLLDEDIGNE